MICSSLIDRADGVNPEGFYMQMFTAQLGAWLSWATWLVVKPIMRVWIQSKRSSVFGAHQAFPGVAS